MHARYASYFTEQNLFYRAELILYGYAEDKFSFHYLSPELH